MPQNQPVKFDTTCSVASSSLSAAPSAYSLDFPPVAYNENNLDKTNTPLCKLEHPLFDLQRYGNDGARFIHP